jgi:hypothetical protein
MLFRRATRSKAVSELNPSVLGLSSPMSSVMEDACRDIFDGMTLSIEGDVTPETALLLALLAKLSNAVGALGRRLIS